MVLSKADKTLLLMCIQTEAARLKRAINASPNQAIRELLDADLGNLRGLEGRVIQEPVK